MGNVHPSSHVSRRSRVRHSLICLVLLISFVDPATGEPNLSHDLEGKQFIGQLGPEGASEPDEEVLKFDSGLLVSKVCADYGFKPAPYWVREDESGLHFFAELKSEESGTIWFEGTFDGEKIRAKLEWEKKRWYWTIEQNLVFNGRPVNDVE